MFAKTQWRETLGNPQVRALGVFIALEAIVFRFAGSSVGFFHDDWPIRYWALEGVGRMMERGFLIRPPQVLYWPLVYSFVGDSPLRGQLLLGALKITEAFALFSFLLRLTGARSLATAAGAILIVFPNREVVQAWLSTSGQIAANALMLTSLTVYLRWLDERRIRWFLTAIASYLAAALLYESTALLPAALGAALWAKRRSFTGALKDCMPFAVSFLAIFAWQRWIGPGLLGVENPRGMAFSLDHFRQVFFVGFECVFNRPVHLAVKTFLPALERFGAGGLALLCAGASVAALWIPLDKERGELPVVAAAAGGAFLGAYAPYAMTADYLPELHRLMSRVNGAGALASAILFAAAFAAAKRGKLKTIVFVAAICAFSWTSRFYYIQYGDSWKLQVEILDSLAPKLAPLPGPIRIVLTGAPAWSGEAVVFVGDYDLAYALIDRLKREDISAVAPYRTLSFDADGLSVGFPDGSIQRHSFEGLYLYHHEKRIFLKVDAPPPEELLRG